MGYETTLYIGEVLKIVDDVFLHKIATIELCKAGREFDEKINKLKIKNKINNNGINERIYFYAIDGNTKIYEDEYGKELVKLSIKDVYNILLDCYKTTNYKRFKWAISLLKSILETNNSDIIYVIPYGH